MFKTFQLVIFILQLITAWKVFEKYGEPGWKGLVPFYSDYVECGKIWNPTAGVFLIAVTLVDAFFNAVTPKGLFKLIAYLVTVALFITKVLVSVNKSKAFGKDFGMAVLLFIFPFIGNLILGFGSDRYLGNRSHETFH